jgi:hypothetical protein
MNPWGCGDQLPRHHGLVVVGDLVEEPRRLGAGNLLHFARQRTAYRMRCSFSTSGGGSDTRGMTTSRRPNSRASSE